MREMASGMILTLVFVLCVVVAIDQKAFEPSDIPFVGSLNGREIKMKLVGRDLLFVEGAFGGGGNRLSEREETFLNVIRHRKPVDAVAMELRTFGIRRNFLIHQICIEQNQCTSQIQDSFLACLSTLGCNWKVPLTICFACKEERVCYSGFIYRECPEQ